MFSGQFRLVSGTPATPQFIEIVTKGYTLESNGATKPDFNIWHYRCPAPLGGGSLAGFITAWQGALQLVLTQVKTTDWTLQSIVAQYFDNPSSPKVEEAVAAPGLVSEDRGPSFQAAVIRKLTGFTGRSWRGSFHFGALPETFTTKDELNVTGQAAYAALKGAIDATIVSGVSDGVDLFYPVVFSSINSTRTTNPVVMTGAWMTSTSLNAKIGTMKRRKERSGS